MFEPNRAIITVGLQFGDEGKGSIVDYLTRKYKAKTIVRFNGGGQAAHNVVTPKGEHHTFSQFGSGTLAGDVTTFLSKFMLVDPLAMLTEARHLMDLGVSDPFGRMVIDENALVVSPYQRAANRLREIARGDGRHGSCGMGIGETMADNDVDPSFCLRMRDLNYFSVTAEKLRFIQQTKRQQLSLFDALRNKHTAQAWATIEDGNALEFASTFCDLGRMVHIVPSAYLGETMHGGTTIFEAAQGVLLDERYGFHPYTTWSTTTAKNALTLLAENNYQGNVIKLGIARAYTTRHGPGPFPTEDLSLDIPEQHNCFNAWQRNFRVGWSDAVLLNYAVAACGGIDYLAITNQDRISNLDAKIAVRYLDKGRLIEAFRLLIDPNPSIGRQATLAIDLERYRPIYETVLSGHLPDALSEQLSVPVGIVSHGPAANDKVDHNELSFKSRV